MSTLEDRQHELQNRIGTIDSEMAELDAQYLALAAELNSTNGTASLKCAETIERRLEALRREKSLALSAQDHINKLLLDQQQQEADEDRRRLAAQAKELGDALCTLNSELDAELVRLREMFERRASILHKLGATGVVEQAFITKLQGRSGPTRAFCASGLHKFISVEKVGQTSFVSLASVNPVLLNIGGDRSPTNGSGEEVS
jgi:hypothetical protein